MHKISSPHRSAAIAVALTLAVGLAAPVHAQDPSTNGASSSGSAGPQQRNVRRARERLICIRGEITGSRIERQVCRTEAEWRAMGDVPGEDRLAR